MASEWLEYHYPLEYVFGSPAFTRDALAFTAIEQSVFEAALAALRAESGFLGPQRLRDLLVEAGIAEDEQQRAFANFIRNLCRPDRYEDTDQVLEQMQAAVSNLEDFDKGREGILLERFRSLSQTSIDSWRLQLKAEKLQGATGRRMRSHRFTTDVRPVFDFERSRIMGMYPITTLTIAAQPSGPFLLEEPFEVVLTERELDRLSDALTEAKKKLAELKSALERSDFVIPEVGMVTGDQDE